MLKAILGYSIVALLLISVHIPAAAEVRIATWNILNLGWDEDKSYSALATVAEQFDFLAIQEVMDTAGTDQLKNKLEEMTQESWRSLASPALGKSPRKEHFVFLWRKSAIEYVDDAMLYADEQDQFIRAPYSARFRIRDTGLVFVAATAHIIYRPSVEKRTPEVRALRAYWEWLAEAYPEDSGRRLLLGDFNLEPSHSAWQPMLKVANPLITEGATKQSSSNGRYVELYDNIWIPKDNDLPIVEAAIFPYMKLLNETTNGGWTNEKTKQHVSDHAPVYVILD